VEQSGALTSLSVSVIIPAFNAAEHLPRALRSVLSQSLPASEILVVDDGSEDGTAGIARGFGGVVRCIEQENAGAAAARNAGIARCSGDLVAFLDADDEWRDHHLEQAVRCLEGRPQLAWYSAAWRKHEAGGAVRTSRPSPGDLVDAGFDFIDATCGGWTCYTPTVVLRRSVLAEVGGFDESLPTAEDIDLWLRIALKHPRIGYGLQPSSIIHRTPGSLTSHGLFTRARAERLAERWEGLAARGDQRDRVAVRRYTAHWMRESLLRPALLEGDRDAATWVLGRFAGDLPIPWRLCAMGMLALPRPLWSLGTRAWIRSRSLRNRLGPRAVP
jgi:glycosyltransferase involved in cell wall biosynthesis